MRKKEIKPIFYIKTFQFIACYAIQNYKRYTVFIDKII